MSNFRKCKKNFQNKKFEKKFKEFNEFFYISTLIYDFTNVFKNYWQSFCEKYGINYSDYKDITDTKAFNASVYFIEYYHTCNTYDKKEIQDRLLDLFSIIDPNNVVNPFYGFDSETRLSPQQMCILLVFTLFFNSVEEVTGMSAEKITGMNEAEYFLKEDFKTMIKFN